jgi:N-acetylglutamate synthase-like GNAT family acetyltransferase
MLLSLVPSLSVDMTIVPQVRFSDSKAEIDVDRLQELFNLGAFWGQNRKVEDLQTAIENSQVAVSMWDGDKLVGIARATSDGVFRATIWDVVIHPDYRGFGFGKTLVEKLLANSFMCRVERIYLTTTYQQKFYEKLGFQLNTTSTMVLLRQ